MEEKVGNREPQKPEETHNLSEVSQILVKSFHIRRLQKQPFLPLLPPPPPSPMQLVRIHLKLYFESHATVPMVIFHNVISSMDHLWKYTKWPLKNWNLVITICRLKMPKVRVIRLQSICGHVMFLFFEYFSYCSFDSLTFSGETFHLRTQNLKKRVF